MTQLFKPCHSELIVYYFLADHVSHSAAFSPLVKRHLSSDMRFPAIWNVRPAKAQTSLRISAV